MGDILSSKTVFQKIKIAATTQEDSGVNARKKLRCRAKCLPKRREKKGAAACRGMREKKRNDDDDKGRQKTTTGT
jgi:hypothetical protein